ncbi:DUF4270 family protein [Wenyingzhuangia sp. chi5]|uniref:DUF4270 family protein n=1 Tax=Wenyingzhuangia gilva TaxID=3057677 RepID=A0ABT8VQE9_9FLAO|nr:DUF4270 family protein [Wenyingzhuangia sp. chi5]MDO3694198.1 DUF4270 family protein [Wenyingzhuangia sp. chi5]
MRLLNIKNFKTIAALGTMVFFMSCTSDVVTTTGGLIDNNNFFKDTINIDPILSTVEIDTVRTSRLDTYLLGAYSDAKLGTLKASIVGQIVPERYPLRRTLNDTLNAITTTSDVVAVLELPLPLVNKTGSTDEFEIANLVGDVSSTIDVTISTFTTYLEQVNTDATSRIYYSDGTNNAGSKENLGTETVLGVENDIAIKSTYKEADSLLYSLKINLDNIYFKTKLLDKLDEKTIANDDDFKLLFKGLKITASKDGVGYVIPFDLSKARLRINYKNTTTATDTIIKKDKELSFKFQGAVYDLYDHDHANSTETDKVYVQGAGGYETSIDISSLISANSVDSQAENWLINQAKIKIYLDDVKDQTLKSFYLYGIKNDGNLIVIDDYVTLGVGSVNGVIGYEDVEAKTDPYIQFYITDFIKKALAEGEIAELRIKAREALDNTEISLTSTTAKGALLLNDVTSTKAPKLEVIYSKIVD